MKFTYQMTPRELAQALALLGTPVVGAWQVYLVVAVTMLPSIVLFAALGAEVCLGWFSLMAISVLVAAAWAYGKRTGYPASFPESMELTPDQLVYTFGQSRIECRWSLIDSYEDHGQYLLIFSNGRPWVLPDRVLADHRADVLQLLNQVINSQAVQANLPPIEIYREQIQESHSLGYSYRIAEEDIHQAIREKFQIVPLASAGKTVASTATQSTVVQRVFTILFFLLVFQVVYFSLGARVVFPRTTLVKSGLTLLGWVLPILWLWTWSKWSWLFRIRAIRQKVPRFESTLKLNSLGWTIANPSSGTLGNWRDLQAILQSDHFFGLKMVNQMAYLIPKRIFDTPAAAEAFLTQSIQLLQQSQLSAGASNSNRAQTVMKETNNPYQAPLN